MADRTVYGLNYSENGWRMVDQGSCVWVKVPGTNVTLQIREGQPATILGAFAADYNAYVEPLRDGDSACWTPTNSVPSSNHLSGTACDLNWDGPDGKTFRLGISEARAYPGDKARNLRELLDFYEKIVFCGGFWSIQDWMHFQMGANTYGDNNVHKVQNFIDRKIRSDGFSTFRRIGGPPPPPPPPPATASRTERYALEVMREGQRRGITPRGIQIAFSVCFVESGWKMYANRNVPESLKRPYDAVGSDHDSVGLFQQRYPMWGSLECLMSAPCSAGLFYDRLAKMNYNDPSRLPGSFAADVQRPAAQYRGRYQERFGDAVDLYNRLSGTPGEDDELSAEAERKIAELHEAFFGPPDFESLSPLRVPGEGKVGNLLEFIRWMDANVHVILELLLVKLGNPDPDAKALLQRVAENTDPNRVRDRNLARAILNELAPGSQPVTRVVNTVAALEVEVEPEALPALREQQVSPSVVNQGSQIIKAVEFLGEFDQHYQSAKQKAFGGEPGEHAK